MVSNPSVEKVITVRQLLKKAPGVSASISHNDVAAIFKDHQDLHAVALLNDNVPVGLISRQTIQELYLQKFGRDLYGRRPCRIHANQAPVLVDIDTPVGELTQVLTSDDQRYLIEGVIVTEAGQYRGLCRGDQLVSAVTHAHTETLLHANGQLKSAIDQLQQTQQQLIQSEKLASLGALVAGIAHELNTPIGNGLMAATTLKERCHVFRDTMSRGLKRSELESFLEQVEDGSAIATRNLHRASELVMSFKQVAVDQTTSQRRKFLLKDLVDEILLTLQPTISRTPWTVTSNVLPELVMDSYPGPLGQVLSNLVQNALIHAFEGCESGNIHIETTTSDERVQISVRDNGRGIPQDLQSRISIRSLPPSWGKAEAG